jgi:small conductance mechanosensitive channel
MEVSMAINPQAWNIHTEINQIIPLAIPAATRVIGAVLILFAGIWLSGKSEYLAAKFLARMRHFDEMLRDFFASIVRYFVLMVTGLTVLSQFGIQTTSLVAIIGAASLAIGLALQGTLSNLAAGVMLLIFRPFRLGHHVQIGGNDGIVKALTLFWTEVVTAENVQIIVPNGQVWGQAIKNLSIYAAPAVTVEARFPVVGTSLSRSKHRLQGVVAALPAVAKTPAPLILADRSPTDNTLQLVVKFTPAGDANAAKSDVIEAVVKELGTTPAPAEAGG